MKIPFCKKLAATQSTTLSEGRYVGTIIQIANLGMQPGYAVGEPPAASVAVVIQLPGVQIAKKMRISDSPLSALFAYLDAALPDPDGYEGDDPLPLTLGRPIAIEVTVKGQYTGIASFHRPESFELPNAPAVAPVDCLLLDDPEMTGDAAKTMFLKLHRDIRSWLSKRIRG
jgi:hypothetical protein